MVRKSESSPGSKDKEIITVDNIESLAKLASTLRGEQSYKIYIYIDAPDGTKLELPVDYVPLTAFRIAKIVEDASTNLSTEENFEYMCEMFNESIKNWRFVNVPKGMANYDNYEISVRDLSPGNRAILERAVAPGLNKSAEALERDVENNRRKALKGMRKPANPVVESTA